VQKCQSVRRRGRRVDAAVQCCGDPVLRGSSVAGSAESVKARKSACEMKEEKLV